MRDAVRSRQQRLTNRGRVRPGGIERTKVREMIREATAGTRLGARGRRRRLRALRFLRLSRRRLVGRRRRARAGRLVRRGRVDVRFPTTAAAAAFRLCRFFRLLRRLLRLLLRASFRAGELLLGLIRVARALPLREVRRLARLLRRLLRGGVRVGGGGRGDEGGGGGGGGVRGGLGEGRGGRGGGGGGGGGGRRGRGGRGRVGDGRRRGGAEEAIAPGAAPDRGGGGLSWRSMRTLRMISVICERGEEEVRRASRGAIEDAAIGRTDGAASGVRVGTGWGRGGGQGTGVVRDSGRVTRSRARGRTPRVLSAEPMALSVLLSDPAPPPPPPCGVRNTGSGEPTPTPSSPPARKANDAPAVSSSSPAMAKPTVRLIGCAIVRRASHACARAMRSRGGGQRTGRARRRGGRQAAQVFWTARGGGQQNTRSILRSGHVAGS